MRRSVIYSALAIGVFGTLLLWMIKQIPLAIGWWGGVAIGAINFSSLLSNVAHTRKEAEQGSGKVVSALRKRFFVRYLALALGFFLIIQLGKQQLGSALAGFVSFYIVMFLDYFFRIRKQKQSVEAGSSLS